MPIRHNVTHRRVGGRLVPFTYIHGDWRQGHLSSHHHKNHQYSGGLFTQGNGSGISAPAVVKVEDKHLSPEEERKLVLKGMRDAFKL